MVIPVLDPATGGPPGIAVAQAVGLGRLGVDVEIAAYDGCRRDTAAGERVGEMVDAALSQAGGQAGGAAGGAGAGRVGLVVRSLGELSRWEAMWCGGAKRVLRNLIPKVDLVHLHGVWDPVLMWAGREARRAGGGRGETGGGGGAVCGFDARDARAVGVAAEVEEGAVLAGGVGADVARGGWGA